MLRNRWKQFWKAPIKIPRQPMFTNTLVELSIDRGLFVWTYMFLVAIFVICCTPLFNDSACPLLLGYIAVSLLTIPILFLLMLYYRFWGYFRLDYLKSASEVRRELFTRREIESWLFRRLKLFPEGNCIGNKFSDAVFADICNLVSELLCFLFLGSESIIFLIIMYSAHKIFNKLLRFIDYLIKTTPNKISNA